jgi:hypothetical protein
MTSLAAAQPLTDSDTGGSPFLRFGTVRFEHGNYARESGSSGWSVQPIPGFGLPVGPPLGMVRIVLEPPVKGAYTVLATAVCLPTTPLLCVNCSDQTPGGFVIHAFEPVSTKTLQNGGFSFLVLQADAAKS